MDTQWAQKYLDILERDEIAQKMQAFYDLLVFYNEKFNLTRIIGREECRIKHFLGQYLRRNVLSRGRKRRGDRIRRRVSLAAA